MLKQDEEAAQAYAEWEAKDRARAVHPVDHAAIETTEPLRSLVFTRLRAANHHTDAGARDLFSACARLGRMLADLGASPTLAAGTIDNAAVSTDIVVVSSARASLVEGYAAAIREAERGASLTAWEYPACVVPIEDNVVAIACGYPSDDTEVLASWAARLATKLTKAKVKRAVLSGPDIAKSEVESALSFVGITVGGVAPPASAEKKKSWLPWR